MTNRNILNRKQIHEMELCNIDFGKTNTNPSESKHANYHLKIKGLRNITGSICGAIIMIRWWRYYVQVPFSGQS